MRIPVCGTSVFHENVIASCTGNPVATTGCAGVGVTSSSSIWYKFTCYQSGTLFFLISGINADDDYDIKSGEYPASVHVSLTKQIMAAKKRKFAANSIIFRRGA